jgi:hypothetical protein
MTFEEFTESIGKIKIPSKISPILTALWYDGIGDWKKAHEITQNISTVQASEVHAYLHRKEGNNSNANYWYTKVRMKICNIPLHEEWTGLVKKNL